MTAKRNLRLPAIGTSVYGFGRARFEVILEALIPKL